MEHFIFLVQIISLILAASALVLLFQIYLRDKERLLLFFIIALSLIMTRTVVFALARYGELSRFFIFSVRFSSHLEGGLVYCSLVYTSHFFLIMAMARLAGRRIPPLVYGTVGAISLYSLGMYILLLLGKAPPFIPCFWRNVTGLSVIPILSIKGILFFCGLFLAFSRSRSARLTAFLLLQSFGQAADGFFYAFEPLRPLTLLLSMILPYGGYLFLLPFILRKKASVGTTGELLRRLELTEEERDMAEAIREGKSNKEIAFERGVTLSVVKHRIFQLYRKCGINSRWELINLLNG